MLPMVAHRLPRYTKPSRGLCLVPARKLERTCEQNALGNLNCSRMSVATGLFTGAMQNIDYLRLERHGVGVFGRRPRPWLQRSLNMFTGHRKSAGEQQGLPHRVCELPNI